MSNDTLIERIRTEIYPETTAHPLLDDVIAALSPVLPANEALQARIEELEDRVASFEGSFNAALKDIEELEAWVTSSLHDTGQSI